jgi:hypothetical protein
LKVPTLKTWALTLSFSISRPKYRPLPPGPRIKAPPIGIDPDLARMGREQDRVVAVERAPGEHRLARLAHRIQRCADLLDVDQAPAGEARQVEHHRLDPPIASRGTQRTGKVASPVLAPRDAAGEENGDGIGHRRSSTTEPSSFSSSAPSRTCAGPGRMVSAA